MLKIYIIENWLDKVDITLKKELRSQNLIMKLFRDISIYKDSRGKPYLSNSNQYINWSHNEKYLIVAFNDFNLGIDMEFKNISYEKDLYDFILHKDEISFLQNSMEKSDFSKIWTSKEAILKCSGEGLVDNLEGINIFDNKYLLKHLELKDVFITICSDNVIRNLECHYI